MRRVQVLALAIAGATSLMSGCVNAPPARGTAAVNDLIAARGAPAASWPEADGKHTVDSDAALISARIRDPISVGTAVEIAFLRSPAIRDLYAELGISQ